MPNKHETQTQAAGSREPIGSVLLPCPFCGMDGLWCVKDDYKDEGWVQCSVCKARGPVGSPHQLAIHYWNRRRSPNYLVSGRKRLFL